MFNEILPSRVNRALDFLHTKGLREIRIRVGQPIVIDFGSIFFLGENGLTDDKEKALILNRNEIEDIVFKASQCSIYAHNEELKLGYLTLSGGARVGICGELVIENNHIKTLKNFSSINIRIPHQVKNCSLKVLSSIYDNNGIFNTLIIAPPGCGKTTFLRDLCYQLSSRFIAKNLLIVDERGEIASCQSGEPQMDIGITTDVYTNCSKKFALENGIRTLTPDVIAMDELAKPEDIEALNYAIGAGVKIIATAHSTGINDIQKKPYFTELLKNKVFERIVVLSDKDGVGTFEGVFTENFVCIK